MRGVHSLRVGIRTVFAHNLSSCLDVPERVSVGSLMAEELCGFTLSLLHPLTVKCCYANACMCFIPQPLLVQPLPTLKDDHRKLINTKPLLLTRAPGGKTFPAHIHTKYLLFRSGSSDGHDGGGDGGGGRPVRECAMIMAGTRVSFFAGDCVQLQQPEPTTSKKVYQLAAAR